MIPYRIELKQGDMYHQIANQDGGQFIKTVNESLNHIINYIENCLSKLTFTSFDMFKYHIEIIIQNIPFLDIKDRLQYNSDKNEVILSYNKFASVILELKQIYRENLLKNILA